MKTIAYSLALLLLLIPLVGSSIDRDPFESLLPQDTVGPAASFNNTAVVINPPAVTIEGILWGTDQPAAIIDGDVYKVGDTLKTIDAKVCRIERNSVFLDYNSKVFEIGSPKKKEAK